MTVPKSARVAIRVVTRSPIRSYERRVSQLPLLEVGSERLRLNRRLAQQVFDFTIGGKHFRQAAIDR